MNVKDLIFSIPKRGKANIADVVMLFGIIDLILLFYGRYAFALKSMPWGFYLAIPIYFIAIYLLLQWATKMNNILWEYSSGKPFIYLILNLAISTTITYALTIATFLDFTVPNFKEISYIFITFFFVTYAILSAFKLVVLQLYVRRHYRKHRKEEPKGNDNNTLIIGAGWTGTNLATCFANDHSIFKPVCFIDDNKDKVGKIIQDLPVAGTSNDIQRVVDKYLVKKIIFAIPSCESSIKKEIVRECIKTKCELKIVPPIQEMVNSFDTKEIKPRDVRIEDLLGREPTVFNDDSIKEYVHGKVVLVTGGGGSIGSELCRQIASFEPKQLIIMDIYENNAYDIQQELVRKYPNLNLDVNICSIADYDRCDILFDKFRPELVFHAAAHKHVPLMEHVPEQAIKNNVVGTFNLCSLACKYNVQRFLLISTDKAVNPTNVMGASKRCCEMIVKYHSQICPSTVFCAVRFGNVLGSNGSVIPLFKRQIQEGGPVTITDKKIIRFFMTIPEAVSLVLETGSLAKSGQIFVLDMGEPVKILDLAENMITLMGLKPYVDIEIKETGLRPGEKLYEELLISGEGLEKTTNKKIFVCQQIDVKEDSFMENLDKLISLAKDNKPEDVVAQLHHMIPTYHTPEEVNSKFSFK